ncbi:MAG: MFS transporter [Verrucomicrobiota bacterium]|nr:MFS transporter [Verrucomicrobiota bacterium]
MKIVLLQKLIAEFRALPRAVYVIFAGNFINRFGHFVMPFLTLYLTGKGYSLGQAGMAMAANGMGGLVASFIGGFLADTIGRRNTMFISLAGNGLCIMALYFANAFPVILLLTACCGFTSWIYPPAANALLTDLVDEDKRVTAFAGVRLSINAGWALGPAVAGFLLGYSFLALFVGDAVTSITYGIMTLLWLPHGLCARKSSRSAWHAVTSAWGTTFRHAIRNRPFVVYALALLPIATLLPMLIVVQGVAMRDRGLPASNFGLVMATNGVLIIACELILTQWTRRFTPSKVITIGFGLFGIGASLMAFAHTLPEYMSAMVVFTVGEMTAFPIAMAYTAKLAPQDMRGRYQGILSLMWALGNMIGPVLGMALYARFGHMAWLAGLILGGLAVAILRLNEVRVKAAPTLLHAVPINANDQ